MFDPEDLTVIEESAWRIDPTGTEVTSIEYSLNGAFVASSGIDSRIVINSAYDGQTKASIRQDYTSQKIANLRFHPIQETLCVAAHRDGYLFLQDVTTGSTIANGRHLGSSVSAMDIDPFGQAFAIGCSDGSVRVYDMEHMQRTQALVKMVARGPVSHATNVFSVMYHPADLNILVGAGWGDKVLFWDLRTGNPERTISGPHVRGPALDMHDNHVLTGSSRDRKPVEIWDFGSGHKIADVPISYQSAHSPPFLVTCARYARNGLDFCVGGGAGHCCVLVFDGTLFGFRGASNHLSGPVCTCAISPFGSGFVAGTENGEISCHMIRLKPK